MKSSDITTFTEARDHLREKLDQARSTGRAVIITNHGRVDGYLLSPEQYDRLVEAEEVTASLKRIDTSVAQFEQGQGVDMKESLLELKERLKRGEV